MGEAKNGHRWLGVLTWLAVGLFVLLSLPIGLHPDDVEVMEILPASSWREVWTSPFKGMFYRPLTVSLTKLSTDACGATALPLRVLQGVLIVATLVLFGRALPRRTSDVARAMGTLCLLASPLTFVSMTPFAVGVSDTLVALAFLGCVHLSERRAPERWALVGMTALAIAAVLAKESGVLVPLYVAAVSLRERRVGTALGMLALVGLYIALRSTMVTAQPVAFSTGFWTEMLRPAELASRFGASLHWLYAYNVVSNASSALFYVPERGQFRLTGATVLAVIVLTTTTFVWLRHVMASDARARHLPLVAVIPLNALLGFTYVRARVMFVAYVAVALLFTPAFDALWRRDPRSTGRKLAVFVLVGWLAVFGWTLVRLRLQAR